MADYFPLLTRAIASLPDQDPARRQAIYRRAREALERQLRGIEPPLGEADILRETLELEDVIRRIEADFAELPPIAAGPAQPVDEIEAPPLPESESGTVSPVAEPAEPTNAEPVIAAQPPRPRQPERPKAETRQEKESARRRLGFFAVAGAIAMLVTGTVAYLKREAPEAYSGGAPQGTVVARSPENPEPKSAGRLGTQPEAPPTAPRSEPAPARNATPPTPAANGVVLPVVSRAFMVLEVPGGAPNQFEGQASWSFAPDPASRSGEKAIRAVIRFAGVGLSIDFTLSRNRDPAVNSSHILFVSFDPGSGQPVVREMSAIEWRERESQNGSAMAGVLVPIQDNVFLIGLDKAGPAVERNLNLLRTQRWMVFEVRLANGRRGAFLIEKGSSGDLAVAEALAAWK